MRITTLVVVLGIFGFQTGAFAAGYEKSILWSGKAAGVAGAAVATTRGSESIFFNPAGLATGGEKEVSLDFSPTWNRFQAPVVVANQTLTSETRFSPVTALTGSYRANPRLGFGFGMYVAGGNRSSYEGLDYSSYNAAFTRRPTLKGDLTVIEIALGGAYEIAPGFRFGAAWRISQVSGTLYSPSVNANTMLDLHIDDLKDTSYKGFKLGLQYESPDKAWGLGLDWRTSISFTAKGTSSGQFVAPGFGINSPITGGEATASSSLPNQISLGGFYALTSSLRGILEYDWTEYHKDQYLTLGGTIVLPGVGTQDLAQSPLALNWRNQSVVRVGFEYALQPAWMLRFGYAYTSDVTPKAYARGIFSPPGPSHSVTAGLGTNLSTNLDLDGALEYNFGKATVLASDGPVAPTFAGDYTFRAYALHAGVNYRF